ncbi:hypothetical protein [Aquimarina macrocephali]|uniref:hypothetical protein n=1 Tax=Aquimarina macrocephali TaxID=666563 RepID=UPI003F68167B
MKIHIEFNFWLWLGRLCFRKLSKPKKVLPDGIPGRRSETALCTGYNPRKRKPGDYIECETDGHYLCDECCHNIKFKN